MDNSPLNELAPELRNTIFQQVLCGYDSVIPVFLNTRNMTIKPTAKSKRQQVTSAYALMSTCKQIWRECAPVFYGGNAFIVKSTLRGCAGEEVALQLRTEKLLLNAWLRCLQDHAKLLRDITLHFTDWSFDGECDENDPDGKSEAEHKANAIIDMHQAVNLPTAGISVLFSVLWTADMWNEHSRGEVTFPLKTRVMAEDTVRSVATTVTTRIMAKTGDKGHRRMVRADIGCVLHKFKELAERLERARVLRE